MAEFQYNNQKHSSTGYSPFQANHGYHPTHPATVLPSPNPKIEDMLQNLGTIRQSLRENLQRAQETYAKYYDRHAVEPPQLDVVDRCFKFFDECLDYISNFCWLSMLYNMIVENS
jgi:hypothetical protein